MEKLRYQDIYLSTYDTIDDTIVYLLEELRNSPTSSERILLNRNIARNKAELSLLMAKRQAFNANESLIRPPTKSEVDQAQQHAKASDDAVRKSNQAVALVGLARSAVSQFVKIQAHA